jgi:integrase
MAKRKYGTGSIEACGENTFRLRYSIDGQRFKKTVSAVSKTEAQKELRRLLRSGDTGEHIAPDKITLGQWIDQWLDAGAPGRRRKKVSQRTLERYGQLLRTHVKPDKQLQQLRAPEIDKLYADIEAKGEIAPRTAHHVHVVLGACLATAHRKGLTSINPMLRVEQVPNPEIQVLDDDEAGADIGEGLDEAELAQLIAGFASSSLYPVVALAAQPALAATSCSPCAGPISISIGRRSGSNAAGSRPRSSASDSSRRRPREGCAPSTSIKLPSTCC